MGQFVIPAELEEKICATETLDEVVQVCAEAGISVTREQLEAAMQVEADGELSEDALDNVSGGGFFTAAWIIWRVLRSGRGRFSSGGGGGGGEGGGGFR